MKKKNGTFTSSNTFFDTVLVVCSKEPSIQGLQLEKISVDFDSSGIKVNNMMTTTAFSVYAVGDCVASDSKIFERDSNKT